MPIRAQEFAHKRSLVRRRVVVSAVLFLMAVLHFLLPEEPSIPSWLTVVATVAAVTFGWSLFAALRALFNRAPAVGLAEDGIRDARLGNRPVPWPAIAEIKLCGPVGSFGRATFLVVDAGRMAATPGPIHMRLANWLRGAWAGRSGKRMVLAMTPEIALDAPPGALESALRAHAAAAAVPVTTV